MKRRTSRSVVGLLLLSIAVGFGFFGYGFRETVRQFERADLKLRLHQSSFSADAWEASGDIPFKISEYVVDLRDDRAWREALVLYGETTKPSDSLKEWQERHDRAKKALLKLANGSDLPAYRSAAFNLVGVLEVHEAFAAMSAQDDQQTTRHFEEGLRAFLQARKLDVSNADAKTNHEILRTFLEANEIEVRGEGNEDPGDNAGFSSPGTGY